MLLVLIPKATPKLVYHVRLVTLPWEELKIAHLVLLDILEIVQELVYHAQKVHLIQTLQQVKAAPYVKNVTRVYLAFLVQQAACHVLMVLQLPHLDPHFLIAKIVWLEHLQREALPFVKIVQQVLFLVPRQASARLVNLVLIHQKMVLWAAIFVFQVLLHQVLVPLLAQSALRVPIANNLLLHQALFAYLAQLAAQHLRKVPTLNPCVKNALQAIQHWFNLEIILV